MSDEAQTDTTKTPDRSRLALTFIIATVVLDTIGIGLIFPVMPDLMAQVTHGTLSQAAQWAVF